MTYIGIDPAFREKGFAVCLLNAGVVTFKTFHLPLDFFEWSAGPDAPAQAFVCIENSNLQNVTFNHRGNAHEQARHSRNVGANQAASEMTVEACIRRWGRENVCEISPKDKGAKITDPDLFRSYMLSCGYKIPAGTISQDKRDAFKIAVIGSNVHRLRQAQKQK